MKEKKELTGQIDSSDNLTLGKRLKVLREERKLTQQDVADYCKIPVSSYANWEQDRSAPSIERIITLSKCMNVTTDVLLGVRQQDVEERLQSRLARLKPIRNKISSILLTIYWETDLTIIKNICLYLNII